MAKRWNVALLYIRVVVPSHCAAHVRKARLLICGSVFRNKTGAFCFCCRYWLSTYDLQSACGMFSPALVCLRRRNQTKPKKKMTRQDKSVQALSHHSNACDLAPPLHPRESSPVLRLMLVRPAGMASFRPRNNVKMTRCHRLGRMQRGA